MESDAVYPRWRGEHSTAGARNAYHYGLSPLARGTLNGFGRQVQIARFIPAGAGNTVRSSVISSMCAVYPRWRGEHSWGIVIQQAQGGLSPLARGTRVIFESNLICCRFIPAGAGNTSSPRTLTTARAVYPRWRGEHMLSQCSIRAVAGLSPLARGTRLSNTGR